MITTRNRVEDLRRTCEALLRLAPAPLEILITADGCTDGTVEFVRSALPGARLTVNEVGRGSVAARDRMMREARGDSCLPWTTTVTRNNRIVLRGWRRSSKSAAVGGSAFSERTMSTRHRFRKPTLARAVDAIVCQFGAVIKRSVYLHLPGFEPHFFHAYEEPDYAFACVSAGYEVYFTPVVTIRIIILAGPERNSHPSSPRQERVLERADALPVSYVLALALYRVFPNSATRASGELAG